MMIGSLSFPTGVKMPRMSPSALETFTMCQSKWYYDKAVGVPRTSSAAAELGSAVHDQLETYLRTGQKPDATTKAGTIATSGLHHLPKPGTVHVETWCPPTMCGPLKFAGKVDFWSVEDDVYSIHDHKTSSNPEKYGKTSGDLLRHPQMLSYAYVMFKDAKPGFVNLEHIYYRTRGGLLSYPVRAVADWETIEANWRYMEEQATQMVSVLLSDEPTRTLSACGAFGGCPYRALCEGSKSMEEKISGMVAKIESFFSRGKSLAFTVFEARCVKEGIKPGAVIKAGKLCVIKGYIQRRADLADLEEVLGLLADAERMMGGLPLDLVERVLKTHGKPVADAQNYLDAFNEGKAEAILAEQVPGDANVAEQQPPAEDMKTQATLDGAMAFQANLPREVATPQAGAPTDSTVAPSTQAGAPTDSTVAPSPQADALTDSTDDKFLLLLREAINERIDKDLPLTAKYVKQCVRDVYGCQRVSKVTGRKLLLDASPGNWIIADDLAIRLAPMHPNDAPATPTPTPTPAPTPAPAPAPTPTPAPAPTPTPTPTPTRWEKPLEERLAKQKAESDVRIEALEKLSEPPVAATTKRLFVFVDCLPQGIRMSAMDFSKYIEAYEDMASVPGHDDAYVYSAPYAAGPKAVASQLAAALHKHGLNHNIAMRSDHPAFGPCFALLSRQPGVVVVR